jgi:carboxypeptidase PM20D1
MVANAEKGVMTLELCVESEPGHSSTPKKQTAIGILAQALTKVEAHPLPPSLNRIEPIMHSVGGAMPFKLQMVFANLWLFQSAAIRALEANPQTNAVIRTTTAITMINGGVRENLLPSSARARVNFRLLPGDTIASVCDHVRKAVGDKRVQINAVENSAWEASPISPIDGAAYQKLSSAIRQTFSGVPVAPSLMLGASDSRHYCDLTEQIYRFGPVVMEREDMARVHGINERLSIDAAGQMVQFFARLIKSWGME